MPATYQHFLADDVEVKLGMRIKDYDAKYGVIEESDANRDEFKLRHVSGERETCNAWFKVVRDDGTTAFMDCSRMISEGGKYDR